MQCSGGSRCLQRRWEPWRWGAQCLAIRSWQRPIESHHQSWSSYNCEKLPKNSRLSILQLFGIRRKLKRWKSSMSGYLISWLQIKKIVTLKCCLLLSYTRTMNHFSIQLWCSLKSGFYMTISDNWLVWEDTPKHFPKPNFHQKKKSRSLFGGLLLLWSTTTFWIPAKP